MAKDVDLSSHEWTELVFEGKNKQFGAYQLRKGSISRHNTSIIVALALVLVAVAGVMIKAYFDKLEAEEEAEKKRQKDAQVEQQIVSTDEPEEVEDEPLVYEQPPEIEEPVHEIEQIENVELLVVDDAEADTTQVKTLDELQQTTAAAGATDTEGSDDINLAQVIDAVATGPVEEKPKEDQVFDAVEQAPQFPGGEEALLKFVADNIRYPALAIENGDQGTVVVRFVVTHTGDVGKVVIARGKTPELDKEAVRVVKKLPKFTPGKQNGHAVNVWYTLPIRFKLQM